MKRTIQLGSQNVNNFLSKYDNFLMDCDGVFWDLAHYQPFPHIAQAVNKLKSLGKRFFVVTNNSRGSRQDLLDRFKGAGIEINSADAFPVSHVAAIYLKDIAKVSGKVYIIGGESVAAELEEHGLQHIGLGPDPDPSSADPAKLIQQKLDPDVKAVLAAYDEHFSYNKVFKAASYLSNPECIYVATAMIEKRCMLAPGYQQPLTGTLVNCVSMAANRQPIVVGKPSKLSLESIVAKNPNMDLSKTIMVGDTLATDVAFARNCGISSLLVLSGNATLKDLEKLQDEDSENSTVPDYFVNNFSDFAKFL